MAQVKRHAGLIADHRNAGLYVPLCARLCCPSACVPFPALLAYAHLLFLWDLHLRSLLFKAFFAHCSRAELGTQ